MKVFSHTANAWVDAKTYDVVDNTVRVEYHVGEYRCRKSLCVSSDHLFVKSKTAKPSVADAETSEEEQDDDERFPPYVWTSAGLAHFQTDLLGVKTGDSFRLAHLGQLSDEMEVPLKVLVNHYWIELASMSPGEDPLDYYLRVPSRRGIPEGYRRHGDHLVYENTGVCVWGKAIPPSRKHETCGGDVVLYHYCPLAAYEAIVSSGNLMASTMLNTDCDFGVGQYVTKKQPHKFTTLMDIVYNNYPRATKQYNVGDANFPKEDRVRYCIPVLVDRAWTPSFPLEDPHGERGAIRERKDRYGHFDAQSHDIWLVDARFSEAKLKGVEEQKIISFFKAAEQGQENIVEIHLEGGVPVDSLCRDGGTALHMVNGHTSTATQLLEARASVNHQNCRGLTPLAIAAQCGDLPMLRLLLEYRATVDHPGMSEVVPTVDRSDIVQILLSARSSLMIQEQAGVLQEAVWEGSTERAKACLDNFRKAGIMHLLLGKIDLPQSRRMRLPASSQRCLPASSLDWIREVDVHVVQIVKAAAQAGQLEILQLLIAEKADIHDVQIAKAAAQAGQLEILQLLIAEKADINGVQREDIQHTAYSKQGNVNEPLARLLLRARCDAMQQVGLVHLLQAAQRGRTDIVESWLELGVPVDSVIEQGCDGWPMKKNGMSALHLAAVEGHADTVKVLLSAMAAVNVEDKDGRTALMLATFFGHLKFTMSHCVKDNTFEAQTSGHQEIIHVLLGKRADPEHTLLKGHAVLAHIQATINHLHGVDGNPSV